MGRQAEGATGAAALGQRGRAARRDGCRVAQFAALAVKPHPAGLRTGRPAGSGPMRDVLTAAAIAAGAILMLEQTADSRRSPPSVSVGGRPASAPAAPLAPATFHFQSRSAPFDDERPRARGARSGHARGAVQASRATEPKVVRDGTADCSGTFDGINKAGAMRCRLCQSGVCPVVSCSGKPAVSAQPPPAPPASAAKLPPTTPRRLQAGSRQRRTATESRRAASTG